MNNRLKNMNLVASERGTGTTLLNHFTTLVVQFVNRRVKSLGHFYEMKLGINQFL